MSRRNRWMVLGGLALAVMGWAAFRPERLFIDKAVNESFEVAPARAGGDVTPQLVSSGTFHDGAHPTHGEAKVYEQPNGKRILRLTGFETSNGPDVQVYLVQATDALDNESVKNAQFVNLGALKGNVGDQNYDVPADVDLQEYRAVTIWCRRFGVNFGTAPLELAATRGHGDETQSLYRGSFHAVAHETSGDVTIYQLASGARVLRFTNFETSNGPDVQVYLIAAGDATDNDTVTRAGFVHVAALKGNVGDQNYELPADVDLQQYRAVTIWCRRFAVNFGTAPLQGMQS